MIPSGSLYERWHGHFSRNRDSPLALPWDDGHRLDPAERRMVARSIQQFQLGEWARGRGLRRRAYAHPILGNDAAFLPALELFIAEEQNHSRMLGNFLDREGIPRLSRHWLDGIFRRLRKLAGLEVCVAVLVTAEVLAIPFYRALRGATRSPLLQAICRQILRDEASHLQYQALTLGLIRRQVSPPGRIWRAALHQTLFRGAALLLWQQHRRVFRAAGWSAARFRREAESRFQSLELQVHRVVECR